MSVQTNLSFLMARAQMNPHSLAKETGVKQPTIFRILEGESLTPRDKTLRPLADFFGVTVQDLRYADLAAGETGSLDKEGHGKDAAATLDKLRGKATPRSQAALDRIEQAVLDGRLSEADLVLLEGIAARFETRKPE